MMSNTEKIASLKKELADFLKSVNNQEIPLMCDAQSYATDKRIKQLTDQIKQLENEERCPFHVKNCIEDCDSCQDKVMEDRLKKEIQRLYRENLGLKTKIENLNEKLYKRNQSYGGDKHD